MALYVFCCGEQRTWFDPLGFSMTIAESTIARGPTSAFPGLRLMFVILPCRHGQCYSAMLRTRNSHIPQYL